MSENYNTVSLYNKKNGLKEIHPENFYLNNNNNKIKYTPSDVSHKNKHGFLLVYAPWCGFCHNPIFVKSNELFHSKVSQKLNTFIVALNGDHFQNEEIMHHLNISGFPTFFHIDPSGNLEEYNEGRNIEERGLYILKKQGKL